MAVHCKDPTEGLCGASIQKGLYKAPYTDIISWSSQTEVKKMVNLSSKTLSYTNDWNTGHLNLNL